MSHNTPFNGGKMYHIFEINENNLYSDQFNQNYQKEAKQALLNGTIYNKVNGSNWLIKRDDSSVTL
jgi:hypothetical protein